MLSNCQNLKTREWEIVVAAENDGDKRFTATFKADVILRML